MRSGTRFILIASVVIAFGILFGLPAVDYWSCKVRLREYTEDQGDMAAVLAHEKTLQQLSNRALVRAANDEGFREGRWNPPSCDVGGRLFQSALLGAMAFVLVFVGAHLAWLLGRAFNKLMDKLR